VVKKVTVRQTGTSVSATIPKEMAERFHIAVGDTLFAIATEHGVLFTPYDPTVDRGLQLYQRFSKEYRDALRKLAE
jgi:putative addiction module antidote